MRGYLLDTGVFLFSMQSPEKINREAQSVLEAGENDLFLSAASSWEISIKCAIGRLMLAAPSSKYIPKLLNEKGIQSLAITQIHALTAGELPRHHRDPFDRMLIAQAMTEDFVLMTADKQFEKYKIAALWCGK